MVEARGWYPIPNEVLDRLMPRLRDTEFRLLCVVCRATLGRRDPVSGKRKRRDWISHAQLVRRTGRGSAAVSRALDVLVRAGLVNAQTEDLRELRTPRERRAHRARVYLSLSNALWEAAEGKPGDAPTAPTGIRPGPERPPRPPSAVRVRRGWERAGRLATGAR